MKKGQKMTLDMRRKLSAALKGRSTWNKGLKGVQVAWNKGKKSTIPPERRTEIYKKRVLPSGDKHWTRVKGFSIHTREKIRKTLMGGKLPIATRLKMSAASLGKKKTLDARKNMSLGQKGERGSNWKGGITPINKLIRRSIEFRLWREAVFARDNWTCVLCHVRGGELHPDHIKQFAYYPELRFAIDNGRTLCAPCHRKTETWGNQKKI